MHEELSAAMALHQAGELEAAEKRYQKILAHDPHEDALHLLGVLHHQQGDHPRAVELIGRAVALRPNVPAFHANLAEAYRALGQFERAVGCCRVGSAVWPDYPEALVQSGPGPAGARASMPRPSSSSAAPRSLRPDFAAGHNNLGIALRELGQLDEALDAFPPRRRVASPTFAPAQTNLGQMLLDRGQAEEALPHCQEAVRLQPELAACTTTWATRCGHWSDTSRPGPPTWKRCGSSPTWPWPTPTSAWSTAAKASSAMPCPG